MQLSAEEGAKVEPANPDEWPIQSNAIRVLGKQERNEGMDLAMLGLDGIGKSTAFAWVAETITRTTGKKVVASTWRSEVAKSSDTFSATVLRDIYCSCHRMLFGSAEHPKGISLRSQLFNEDTDVLSSESIQKMATTPVSANDPRGLIGSALLDIAGNVAHRMLVTEPLIKNGYVVVQDSYGYKSVVKQLVAARLAAASEGSIDLANEADMTLDFATQLFGRLMRPVTGLLLDGEPSLALRRRSQRNSKAILEDLTIIGQPGRLYSVRFFAACRRQFLMAAKKWKWPIVQMADEPPAASRRKVTEATLAMLDTIGLS